VKDLVMINPPSLFYNSRVWGLHRITRRHFYEKAKQSIGNWNRDFIYCGTDPVCLDGYGCGLRLGTTAGGDYVPQRRDSNEFLARKSAISEDQAREIVSGYVKKLNPSLEIGKVTDNGGFYEVEIVDSGDEIVQLLGVDKRSGRLILLN
jgi:hypothetical protein